MTNSHLPITEHVTAQISSHLISIQFNAQANGSNITAQKTEYQVGVDETFPKLRPTHLCCELIPLFYQKIYFNSHTNPQLLVFEFPPPCSPSHLEKPMCVSLVQ